MRRRAKIAGTLGPSSDRPGRLAAMIEAGLDVARINFSHGTLEDHRRRARAVERAARRAGRSVALLADLQGPRLRVGRLPGGRLGLAEGDAVTLVAGRERAAPGEIPVALASIARDVGRGAPVLIDDGRVALEVERVRDRRIRCVVRRGGEVADRKGINLPGVALSLPALTPKDRRDALGAAELGADWLAISFVRRPEDLRAARRLLERAGRTIPLVAKIERPEAIDRLDAILEEADGLLVARGDLGVELDAARVPILQKQIIEAATAAGKPVITATQMLDSMRESPRPTRAEASDVANAVLDGSGCLLLTAETAAGRYPVEAVATMARIIEEAERSGRGSAAIVPAGELGVPLATCRAASRAAADIGARYLIAFTHGGFTARQVSRLRPETPVIAYTPEPRVERGLNLLWGVEPRRLPAFETIEALMRGLDRSLLSERLAKRGDRVVVLCGWPIGVSGTTNLVQVHRVGSAR